MEAAQLDEGSVKDFGLLGVAVMVLLRLVLLVDSLGLYWKKTD
jgi:hypothetical protein